MQYVKLKAAIFSCCCGLMLSAMLLTAGVQPSLWQKAHEELIRYTILEAEAMLNSGDCDFADCIIQWRRLTQIAPGLNHTELKARTELLRLLFVKRSLELIPRRPMLELEAWLNVQAEHIYFCDVECHSWMVKPEKFWDLHDEFHDTTVADDIAWAAATNPWGGGCEGSASCELDKWNSSMGKYIKLHPEGKYVFLALEKLVDICHGIQNGKLEPSIHDVSTAEILQKIIELVGSISGARKAGYCKQTQEILESTWDQIRKIRGRAEVRKSSSEKRPYILEDSLDGWLEDWFRARRYRDLNDYFFYWKELKKIIPGLGDELLAARAKLIRLLCIKQTLALLDRTNVRSKETDEWREEVKELTELGAVKSELFWELQEEHAHLPIADDIAWVAANNPDPTGDYGPDISTQLVKLDSTVIRYLGLFPEGKYVRVALSRIITFCRTWRGEDLVVSTPRDFIVEPYILDHNKGELERIHETLKRVLTVNENDRIARQAMAEFERTFKQDFIKK